MVAHNNTLSASAPMSNSTQPQLPLSQWLLQDLPASQQAKIDSFDIASQVPNSAGLPTIVPLGPQATDFCSNDDLCLRQYCMLVGRATVNDWSNLATDYKQYILQYDDINYLPVHYKKALEALLCCHIFAGIPRCIEALHTVRNAETKYFNQLKQLQSQKHLTPRQKQYVQHVTKIKSIIDANQPKNDISEYISTDIKPCQCKCTQCNCTDVHATNIRAARGDTVLKLVYRNTYDTLRQNLRHNHQNLWQYIQENVYGVQLARTVLTIQEIECVAVSSLIGMQCERQILSHMRGAKLNGVKYELLLHIIHDLRLVYAPSVIETAIKQLNRIYKVKPETDNILDDVSEEQEQPVLRAADKQTNKTVDRMHAPVGRAPYSAGTEDVGDKETQQALAKLNTMRQLMQDRSNTIDEVENLELKPQFNSNL